MWGSELQSTKTKNEILKKYFMFVSQWHSGLLKLFDSWLFQPIRVQTVWWLFQHPLFSPHLTLFLSLYMLFRWCAAFARYTNRRLVSTPKKNEKNYFCNANLFCKGFAAWNECSTMPFRFKLASYFFFFFIFICFVSKRREHIRCFFHFDCWVHSCEAEFILSLTTGTD